MDFLLHGIHVDPWTHVTLFYLSPLIMFDLWSYFIGCLNYIRHLLPGSCIFCCFLLGNSDFVFHLQMAMLTVSWFQHIIEGRGKSIGQRVWDQVWKIWFSYIKYNALCLLLATWRAWCKQWGKWMNWQSALVIILFIFLFF